MFHLIMNFYIFFNLNVDACIQRVHFNLLNFMYIGNKDNSPSAIGFRRYGILMILKL